MNNKEEMLQWILSLEDYAKAKGLSMRIIDNIGDCREHIVREDLSWQELSLQIEEILESVRLKVQPADAVVQIQGGNRVPVEKVQEKVRGMAEDCHRDNRDSIAAIEVRKNLNVKESVRKMGEITHTEAHLEKMLDINQYTEFFRKIMDSYERDMAQTAGEMISGISGNYDHMADHMKSMFHSMGNHADGIGNEKFYHEYESAKTEVENQLVSDVRTVDLGGGLIMEFAGKTKEKIQSITKKALLTKKLLAFAPVMFVLVIFLGWSVISLLMARSAQTSAEQSPEESAITIACKIFRSWMSTQSEGDDLMKLALFAWIIAAILIIFVVYRLYLRKLKRWCSRRICEDCGRYLRAEFAAFEKEDQLTQKAGEAIAQIAADCEQRYLVILNRIFVGTRYEEKGTQEGSGFDHLQEKWNHLKYN